MQAHLQGVRWENVMQASRGTTLPARLQTLAVTAALLERLERKRRTASPAQYQTLARQLREMLAAAEPDPYLDALLDNFPATAELYENLRYEQLGLCRSSFDAALHAEMQAMSVIESARRIR
jgi:hypothetical protein